MKTSLFVSLLLLTFISCEKSHSNFNSDAKPTKIETFCQSDPDKVRQTTIKEYLNGNVIKEIYNENRSITYTYNKEDKISHKHYKYKYLEESSVYIYGDKKYLDTIKTHVVQYDYDDGTITDESDYVVYYKYDINGNKIEEWFNIRINRSYEYSGGNLIKSVIHNSIGNPHHIFHYEYDDENLKKETKKTVGGRTIYIRDYFYDGGLLDIVKEDGNIIERRTYDEDVMIKRETFYFGIDPGFDPCYGNYIYLYEY